MEDTNIRRCTHIAVRYAAALHDGLVIAAMHLTHVKQQVAVGNGGNDHAEGTPGYAHTLRVNVVVDVRRTEERVVVDLQTVEFLQTFHQILVDLGRVGLGEDVTEVTDVVIDPVSLDTVVVLDALQKTVSGL